MERIVVGADGSDDSVRALRWALAEAAQHGAEIELVHAYTDTPFSAYATIVAQVISVEDLRHAAEDAVTRTLEAAGGAGDVTVTRTVAVGGAAGVLCDRAAGADLLVVGARGLGGFRGLLVGSVSQQVIAHSPCPVVVVPRAER